MRYGRTLAPEGTWRKFVYRNALAIAGPPASVRGRMGYDEAADADDVAEPVVGGSFGSWHRTALGVVWRWIDGEPVCVRAPEGSARVEDEVARPAKLD